MAIAPSTDFAAELKQYIAGSSYYMANHPLVDGVYRGTIPAHQLRGWAIQDSHYRRAVPRLAMVRYLRCTDPEIQLQLAEVLAEESEGGYYGSSGHYELFLDFCEALGASRDEVNNSRPLPGPAAHVYWAELIAWTQPWFVAMSAQLAGEGQFPAATAKMHEGLRKHYGLSDAQTAFFDVHGEADEEHGEFVENIIRKYLVTPELQAQSRALIQRKLELQWDMWNTYLEY